VIGVTIRELRSEERLGGADASAGIVIDTVRDDTPAARAGFRSGDIVVEFDGERVRGTRSFSRLVAETPPGRTVTAVVVRGGARQSLQVTPEAAGRVAIELPDIAGQLERGLRSMPRDFNFNFDIPRGGGLTLLRGARLGIGVSSLSEQLARYFGVQNGVLVESVQDGSIGAQAGLRAGDVITAVNGRTITSVADLTAATRDAAPGSTIEIQVMRDRQATTLRATMPQADPQERRIPARGQVRI
jgi:serine protease Do